MSDDKDFDWLDDDEEVGIIEPEDIEEVLEDDTDEDDVPFDMEPEFDDGEVITDNDIDDDANLDILEGELVEDALEEVEDEPIQMHTHVEEVTDEHTEKYMSTVIQVLQPVSQTSMDHIYRQLRSTRGTLYAVGDVELIDLTDTDVAILNEGMI